MKQSKIINKQRINNEVSCEISRSKIGPFSLTCTDRYIGIGCENQSRGSSDSAKSTANVQTNRI